MGRMVSRTRSASSAAVIPIAVLAIAILALAVLAPAGVAAGVATKAGATTPADATPSPLVISAPSPTVPSPTVAAAPSGAPAPLPAGSFASGPLPWIVPLGLVAAPRPGSGAWYWPTGSEDFGGYSGWLDDRGATWHVAQDMACPYGHPVYAIAAGIVWKASTSVVGYGPGGGSGGAIIIVHTTASGVRFRALYGHVMDLRCHAGQRVAAGAVIARINAIQPSHLHFSVHPGTKYVDGNPWAGSVPKGWSGHGGFVDPVKFLKSHPRVIPYLPPRLPLTTVATDATPSDIGAVAGVAYWSEQVSDATVVCFCDLTSGARGVLVAGASAPAGDDVRYRVALLPAPATGFTVADRQPVLTSAGSTTTPAWNAVVTVRARLTSGAGKPFQGARLVLERRAGSAWLRLAAAQTTADGRLALGYTPSRRTVLRLRYVPPAKQPAGADYLALEGAPVTLTPHVALTRPSLPASVSRRRPVAVSGRLRPRRAATPGSVTLLFERRKSGAWTTVLTVATAIHIDGAGARWTAVVRPPAAGSWRVRAAYAGAAGYAATTSGRRAFTVR
jgi:murein DD-endopeptidase MepM/ murein hydrolase activator NlpD